MGGVRGLIAVPRPDPASAVNGYSRPKASITAGSSLFEASICLEQKCHHRYTGPPYACLEHRMSDAWSSPL